jgi:cytochrome c oxidase assembly factor CtaG
MAGVGAMWFWHIPALCTASMRSPPVFAVQILSLITAGAAFWWPVFCPIVQRRMQPHLATGYLFAGCLGCTLLGIYVAFSPIPVCPLYCHPTGSAEVINLIDQQWGFTPRADQQVGGLLMWVPACLVYLSAIIASLRSWYQDPYQNGSPSIPSATE